MEDEVKPMKNANITNVKWGEIYLCDTTTLDMVTEGRNNNAVISFNDVEEDETPLHIGDVIGLTELQQYFPNLLKNENQNGIITTVGKCGKKSSLDAILHTPSLMAIKRTPFFGKVISVNRPTCR